MLCLSTSGRPQPRVLPLLNLLTCLHLQFAVTAVLQSTAPDCTQVATLLLSSTAMMMKFLQLGPPEDRHPVPHPSTQEAALAVESDCYPHPLNVMIPLQTQDECTWNEAITQCARSLLHILSSVKQHHCANILQPPC